LAHLSFHERKAAEAKVQASPPQFQMEFLRVRVSAMDSLSCASISSSMLEWETESAKLSCALAKPQAME
jgi:hypothetical protein